jgi:hypothetical protein
MLIAVPRAAVKNCKGCGKHVSEVGVLSWNRLCAKCGTERLAENIHGLTTMSGEPLARWRRGMAASVGAVLLDDAGQKP